MQTLKLFITLLGGRQKEDKIEAHNFFAGVGESVEALLPRMKRAWNKENKLELGYRFLKELKAL